MDQAECRSSFSALHSPPWPIFHLEPLLHPDGLKTFGSWWPWETPPRTCWAWVIVELIYTNFKTLPGLSTSSSWIIDEGGCSLGRHPGLALGAEWILVGDRSNFLPFYWSTAFVQSGSWLARITYSTSEVKTSNSPTSGSWYIYSICRTFVSWTRYKTAHYTSLELLTELIQAG